MGSYNPLFCVPRNRITMKKIILFLNCLLNISLITAGFTGNTLVKTPKGLVRLQSLKVGDTVICYKGDGRLSEKPIQSMQGSSVEEIIKVITQGGDVIYSSKDARFLLPKEQKWAFACDLQPGNLLLQQNMERVEVKSVKKLLSPTNIFDIGIKKHHNFGISENNIIVHNLNPLIVPIATEAFEAVLALYRAAKGAKALYDLMQHYNDLQNTPVQNNSGEGSGSGVENPVQEPGGAPLCPCGHTCGTGCNCGCFCGCGKTQKTPLEKILEDAVFEGTSRNRIKIYGKNNSFEDALRDFESLHPTDVKPIKDGNGLTGTLPDGTQANVRWDSSDGRSTLEIYNPFRGRTTVKVRYAQGEIGDFLEKIQKCLENLSGKGFSGKLPGGSQPPQINNLMNLGQNNPSGTGALSLSPTQSLVNEIVNAIGGSNETMLLQQEILKTAQLNKKEPYKIDDFIQDPCKLNPAVKESRKVDPVKPDLVVPEISTPTKQNPPVSPVNTDSTNPVNATNNKTTGGTQWPGGNGQHPHRQHHDDKKNTDSSKLPLTFDQKTQDQIFRDKLGVSRLSQANELEMKAQSPVTEPSITIGQPPETKKVSKSSAEFPGLTEDEVREMFVRLDDFKKQNEKDYNEGKRLFNHDPKKFIEYMVGVQKLKLPQDVQDAIKQSHGGNDGTENIVGNSGKHNDKQPPTGDTSNSGKGTLREKLTNGGQSDGNTTKTTIELTPSNKDNTQKLELATAQRYTPEQEEGGVLNTITDAVGSSLEKGGFLNNVAVNTLDSMINGPERERNARKLHDLRTKNTNEHLLQEYKKTGFPRINKVYSNKAELIWEDEDYKAGYRPEDSPLNEYEMRTLHSIKMQEMKTQKDRNAYAKQWGLPVIEEETPCIYESALQDGLKNFTGGVGAWGRRIEINKAKTPEEKLALQKKNSCDSNGVKVVVGKPIEPEYYFNEKPQDFRKIGIRFDVDDEVVVTSTQKPKVESVDTNGVQTTMSSADKTVNADKPVNVPKDKETQQRRTNVLQKQILGSNEKNQNGSKPNNSEQPVSQKDDETKSKTEVDSTPKVTSDVANKTSGSSQHEKALDEFNAYLKTIGLKPLPVSKIDFSKPFNEMKQDEKNAFLKMVVDFEKNPQFKGGDGRKLLDELKKQQHEQLKNLTKQATNQVQKRDNSIKQLGLDPQRDPNEPYREYKAHLPSGTEMPVKTYYLHKKIPWEKDTTEEQSSSEPTGSENNDTFGKTIQGTQAVLGALIQHANTVRAAQEYRFYPQVDNYYRIHGTYLCEEYQEFLDDLLLHSKIKLSDEKKRMIERNFAFLLLCDPDLKNCLKDHNPKLSRYGYSETTDGVYTIRDIIELSYNKFNTSIAQAEVDIDAVREKAKKKVEEDYKKCGTYISKYHKQILDTALSVNKIQLTLDQRKRIERQLAVNFLVDYNYKNAFEICDLTITKNNMAPNKDSIRNVDDVFRSIYSRFPEDLKLFYEKNMKHIGGSNAMSKEFYEFYHNPHYIAILMKPKDYVGKEALRRLATYEKYENGKKERIAKFEALLKKEAFEKEARQNLKKHAALLVQHKQTIDGTYANEKYNEKLDRLLAANQIQLTKNRRLRLEKQLAFNCHTNPYYKNAFEQYDVNINADNKTPNSNVIKNLNDVFISSHNRYKNNKNKSSQNDQKIKDALILECSEEDVFECAVCDIMDDKKYTNQEALKRPLPISQLSGNKLDNLMKEYYVLGEAKTKAQRITFNRISALIGHINPNFKNSIDKSFRYISPYKKDECENHQKNLEEEMRNIFAARVGNIYKEISEYKELSNICKICGLNDGAWLDKRIAVIDDMQKRGVIYEARLYKMQESVRDIFFTPDKFYGNQLQHVVHQDSITLIERILAAEKPSIVYTYREALIDFINAAHCYNEAGFTQKAFLINDFCRSVLDYGNAILEGAVQGFVGTTKDCIENPFQSELCVAADEYLLAYQLCRVVFNVAEIELIPLVNVEHDKQKWNDFLAPVSKIIETLRDKHYSLFDPAKDGASFSVHYFAQRRLSSGLGKFFETIKVNALDFIEKNPKISPKEYLAKQEGLIFKVALLSENNKLSVSCVSRKLGDKPQKEPILKMFNA